MLKFKEIFHLADVRRTPHGERVWAALSEDEREALNAKFWPAVRDIKLIEYFSRKVLFSCGLPFECIRFRNDDAHYCFYVFSEPLLQDLWLGPVEQ